VWDELIKQCQSVPRERLLRGDVAEEDQFPDKSYDIVVALGVLATVPRNSLQEFANTLRRVARKMVLVTYLHAETYQTEEGLSSFDPDEIEDAFGRGQHVFLPGGVTMVHCVRVDGEG
jgi:hypothetical protein